MPQCLGHFLFPSGPGVTRPQRAVIVNIWRQDRGPRTARAMKPVQARKRAATCFTQAEDRAADDLFGYWRLDWLRTRRLNPWTGNRLDAPASRGAHGGKPVSRIAGHCHLFLGARGLDAAGARCYPRRNLGGGLTVEITGSQAETRPQSEPQLPWHKPEIERLTISLDTGNTTGSGPDGLTDGRLLPP